LRNLRFNSSSVLEIRDGVWNREMEFIVCCDVKGREVRVLRYPIALLDPVDSWTWMIILLTLISDHKFNSHRPFTCQSLRCFHQVNNFVRNHSRIFLDATVEHDAGFGFEGHGCVGVWSW
jgi:hypothetical protein